MSFHERILHLSFLFFKAPTKSKCIVHMFTTKMDDYSTHAGGLVRGVFVENPPDEALKTLKYVRYTSLSSSGDQEHVGNKPFKVRPILDFTFETECRPQSGCWVIPSDIRSLGTCKFFPTLFSYNYI